MEETKFRGIDKHYSKENGYRKNIWRYGNLIINRDGSMAITKGAKSYGYGIISSEVIPETAGQYTGLKDKNGKEIYEGDIVQNIKGKSNRYKVYYCNKRAGCVMERVTNKIPFPSYENISNIDCDIANAGYEIIGNIYENPELLEGE